MLFRPQRGSLADAMAEVFEFSTWAELEAHITKPGFFAPTALVIVEPYPRAEEPPSFDARIGWHTYIVIARYPDGHESPAGYTNGPVVDSPSGG